MIGATGGSALSRKGGRQDLAWGGLDLAGLFAAQGVSGGGAVGVRGTVGTCGGVVAK